MCRNIRTLHNFEPPATRDEVHAAAVQYVRKISGTTKPSQANQEAFDEAVAEVTAATRRLLEQPDHDGPAEGPRGRGGQGPGAGRGPLRAWLTPRRRRPARLLGAARSCSPGAGLSTDSGIPDYRGPGAPVRMPMTYQEFVASAGQPAALLGPRPRRLVADGLRRAQRRAPGAGPAGGARAGCPS